MSNTLNPQSISVTVGGKELTFETGKIARQANGAVMLSCGETMILSTACAKNEATAFDFFPLTINYNEKFSGKGSSLGGFIKREGRPTQRETLLCRLIDRPLRPLFEDGFFSETQVITTTYSFDGIHAPDPLAICASSAALVISDIPFKKAVGAVRVGMIDGDFVINPTIEEQENSVLDLLIAGTSDAVLMIEGYCDFLTEEQVLAAIHEGHEAIKTICSALTDWRTVVGKDKNRSTLRLPPEGISEEIKSLLVPEITEAIRIKEKEARSQAIEVLKTKVTETLCPGGSEEKYPLLEVKIALKSAVSHFMREMYLNEKMRIDGRGFEEIRPIHIDVNPLPRTHGSALFTRGETQAIAVCTLGNDSMGQRFETLLEEGTERFYLQYFFPPFSVGEVGRMGPAARREVGHGKLAERALNSSIPNKEAFPYTIRLESNITESNGSSSMASVCGGCVAMMAGGVPIKRPVSGIAMGLIIHNDEYVVLSDILGMEDALGDMDFKITGDDRGITAFQLDIKVEGITKKIMEVALLQAKQGRIHILNKMLEACPKPATSLSQHAPKMEIMMIPPSKIGVVIGPGGKQIRAIVEETGVDIDIDDNGAVSLSTTCQDSLDKAKEIVYNLTADPEIGKTYNGVIVSIKDFGMFVKVLSKEGLCHISEIAHERIDNINDHYKEGDKIDVKVLDINDRGQIRLSHKALLEKSST